MYNSAYIGDTFERQVSSNLDTSQREQSLVLGEDSWGFVEDCGAPLSPKESDIHRQRKMSASGGLFIRENVTMGSHHYNLNFIGLLCKKIVPKKAALHNIAIIFSHPM